MGGPMWETQIPGTGPQEVRGQMELTDSPGTGENTLPNFRQSLSDGSRARDMRADF